MKQAPATDSRTLTYYGGWPGALFPFLLFVAGVVGLALSGAPEERGFWPVLLVALTVALALARERQVYCEVVIEAMSRPIVMIMIMAWMLASTIGVLMSRTGFIEALTWSAGRLHLGSTAFVGATFLICCLVSASTGTSFGTILICGPLLYPAGGLLGAHLPTLAGAILGGATFGDSISPISDTTIASALTQQADIAGTVRSRLKYVVPAGALALVVYLAWTLLAGSGEGRPGVEVAGSPRGLPMMAVPILIIVLLLSGRHLLHGLLAGLAGGVLLALGLGLLSPAALLSLDATHHRATSIIIDGIDRAMGISVFTILLLGLVGALEATGVLERLVAFSALRSRSVRAAETWIVGVVSAAVLLTTHSVVAILTTGDFARETGERFGIHPYRRSNLLDLTVTTYPFLFPYFLPVILAASTTASGADYGIPPASPLQVGLHNFHSWAVLLAVALALATGFGRQFLPDAPAHER